MNTKLEPWVTNEELSGQHIKLTALQASHQQALLDAAADGELWKLWYTSVPSSNTIAQWYEHANASMRDGTSAVYVVTNIQDGKVLGSTRFCNIDAMNKRLEIGYTWYSKSVQKTHVNTECKLLLLTQAFEVIKANAVEFRTHWHNHASRNAISRLGAKQDGILRQHQIMPDGSLRDTVVFSILNHEWPSVKNNLQFKLAQPS